MFSLSEPPVTPYDLRFGIFGFPVRVSSTFWLLALLLGWNNAEYIDFLYQRVEGGDTPGHFVLLAIWCGAIFLSILVHELGHTLAFRYFGIDSQIVLYHFGGLAIPSGAIGQSSAFRPSGRRSSSRVNMYSQMIISAAGPAAQLLLAAIVAGIAIACGWNIGQLGGWLQWIGIEVPKGNLPGSAAIFAAIDFIVFPSVFWAIFNLTPVIPMDGGQIAREMIQLWFGGTQRDALILSMIIAGAVAIWGMTSGQPILGFYFASMAVGNWQMLQFLGGGTPRW